MWCLSTVSPHFVPPAFRAAWELVLVVVGVAFTAAGMVAFRRAKTTVNPLEPGAATTLVISGVYRLTRNPMYVGLAFLLAAWAVFLWSPWALLGLPAFVVFISRLQIAPEQRALLALFGRDYAAYVARVRPWL